MNFKFRRERSRAVNYNENNSLRSYTLQKKNKRNKKNI